MLQSITLENFKSYKSATLPLAELTVLIGANASGKSNLIEAIQLLAWIAKGRRLSDLVMVLKDRELSVRGTPLNLADKGGEPLSFYCDVTDDSGPDLHFQMQLDVDELGMRIVNESLWMGDTGVPLYQLEKPATTPSNDVQVAYNNFARGGKKPRVTCIDQQAVFTQLTTPARFGSAHARSQKEIPGAAERLRRTLNAVLFLDPVPGRMRDYSFVVERNLRGDGANVSAVLHELCQTRRGNGEVLEFVRSLPEQDILGIDFLEGPRGEVMVKLRESFGGRVRETDAALLSDGTLRVLAVAAALLSVPEGSMVVIEEIDNGVHPSRAESLLNRIQAVAKERALRVLLTTHNPALLDAIPVDSIPDVVACYRDPEQGDSRLVRLQDLERYPDLVAQGPIGKLVTKGILDRFLKNPPSPEKDVQDTQDLLAFLRRPGDAP
ncbi:AAA family ATPase [Archangium primigenium]|uniref:AAA family ATPase n=1 Tax=[Archangium] primigenium TaxID=2792470 RepID=UPI00195875BA|nr:ATP-binding protein [Archangium primigenium]MBM7112552.1 AAA family ATPase [Archangium primigenium]